MRPAARPLLSLRRCKAGAVAMEFALIAPILSVMLFSIIEYGFVFVAYSSMHMAATSTARQLAVNDLTVTDAPATVKARMPAWVANASTVTAVPTVAANPNNSTVTVTVTAPVANATPLSYFTLQPNWTLTSTATVKQELPCDC